MFTLWVNVLFVRILSISLAPGYLWCTFIEVFSKAYTLLLRLFLFSFFSSFSIKLLLLLLTFISKNTWCLNCFLILFHFLTSCTIHMIVVLFSSHKYLFIIWFFISKNNGLFGRRFIILKFFWGFWYLFFEFFFFS